MQLTRLEIKGFKSFADKVVINFDEGITGIVGPNGCGKSNVVDSIRWVLGEQKSRVLRSEKMENIIFNGTKNRKPTQMAEVSLTFNNTKNLIPTEYSQVTISRRYYRSGESEYLLNGVTCRLKDITNLFLDTGIASNSYAIIELKMVDDLLNDKENSRRSLFEEAAGISKFKIRKKETLKKLSDTGDDLDRVEDLIFEIEKNLRSLERQAKQAKRYFEIKEQYKAQSIHLARLTIQSLNEIAEKIAAQITQEQTKRVALNTSLDGNEATLEKHKKSLLDKEKLLASRQKTLNEHVHKIRQHESDKKIRNERQRFLEDKIQNLKDQITQDKQSNERSQFSIESLQKEKAAAQLDFDKIQDQLNALKADYENQKTSTQEEQQRLNENRKLYHHQRELIFQENKEIEIKEVQLQALRQELGRNQEDVTAQSSSIEEFAVKLKEIEAVKDRKEKELSELMAKASVYGEKIDTRQSHLNLLSEEFSTLNRQLDAKQNEFNLTKSLVESLEGFPEAIRFLKKDSQFKNTPLLSDILVCPEEFRVCIENYLEPFMNYYVVPNLEEALQALTLLSESSRGRASFFILDQLSSHHASSTQLIPGATAATEIIEYDDLYGALISYLLENTFIFEGPLPKDVPDDITLIEKSGKIIKKRYSVTGGSVGLFEGKRIGRAKNLEKLEIQIKELNKKKDRVSAEIASVEQEVSEMQQLRDNLDLQSIRDQIQKVNESFISLKTRKEQFDHLISSNSSKREALAREIEILEKDLISVKPAHDEKVKGLQEMESVNATQQAAFQSSSDLLEQKSAIYNQENVKYHQHLNKVQSLESEIGYKKESHESSLIRIKRNQDDLSNTNSDLEDLVRKTNLNDDDLISLYEEKTSIENGVNEAEKEYYQVRGEIDKTEKEIRDIVRQRETVDQVLMQWQNKANETALQINSVQDRFSVEFGLSLDQELQTSDTETNIETTSEDDLRKSVDKLKERLDAMGPINPMAMEAYQEIKERHTFILEQRDDLLEAKASLLETIKEIDEVAKETFLNAFTEIKENFIRVFRTLFTEEDDCDLYLTEPDNPLESPIDIIAKPKGKRPLTINQLSGGEKTLTATSLLFAIYLLKPAPFCIFDEVDAPLDDANIDKFNHIIRKFSSDSQFIIVTHNKRTMASTDVIYGVTMIEQGISRVVPVDLRQLA